MEDTSKIREVYFDFTEEQKQELQEIIDRSKPIGFDEVVTRDVGHPEIIEEGAFCPACREKALLVYHQAIYHGPYGKMSIGSPHPKQYMTSELRKRCRNCGMLVWKLASHVRRILGFDK